MFTSAALTKQQLHTIHTVHPYIETCTPFCILYPELHLRAIVAAPFCIVRNSAPRGFYKLLRTHKSFKLCVVCIVYIPTLSLPIVTFLVHQRAKSRVSSLLLTLPPLPPPVLVSTSAPWPRTIPSPVSVSVSPYSGSYYCLYGFSWL